MHELPANAFFPTNPWKQEEEGKRQHLPRSSAGVMTAGLIKIKRFPGLAGITNGYT